MAALKTCWLQSTKQCWPTNAAPGILWTFSDRKTIIMFHLLRWSQQWNKWVQILEFMVINMIFRQLTANSTNSPRVHLITKWQHIQCSCYSLLQDVYTYHTWLAHFIATILHQGSSIYWQLSNKKKFPRLVG